MMDYADGAMDRNYAIRANSWLRTLGELVLISAPVVMIAAALLFYSWTRTQLVAIGYESQSLQAEEQLLRRQGQGLTVEEERLKHPERIGIIAQSQLGMTRLKPSQVLPSSVEDLRRATSDSMALATVATPRKTGTRD